MQWHPLFAKLLRPVLEGYYEVQTNVPVGDVPREADIVVVRRSTAKAIPFRGLWKYLRSWNVLEFKGPTVSARVDDLDLLVELGLGIERKVRDRLAGEKRRLPAAAVSYWYLVHRLGRRFLRTVQEKLGPLEAVDRGIWMAHVLQRPLVLVSSVHLPLAPESLPLHLLEEQKGRELADLLRSDQSLWSEFAPYLLALHPDMKEIQAMGKAKTKGPKFHLKPLLDLVGVEEFVRQAGGVDTFIDRIGPMSQKKMLDSLLARMTPDQRRSLKDRLA
jgi:hypothetical protein